MRFWTISLTIGICLVLGAGLLLAQPADDPRGPDGPGRMARRRPGPGQGDQQGERPPRQGDRGQGPGRADGRRPHRGLGPLMMALDTDRDGVLSAAEIAAASANLKKLDRNEDGKVDRVELRPPRRDGDGEGDKKGFRPRRGPDAQDGQGQGPRGQGQGRRRLPPPPPQDQES